MKKTNDTYFKNGVSIFFVIIIFSDFIWLYRFNNINLKPALADAFGTSLLLYGLLLCIKFSHGKIYFSYSRLLSDVLQSLLLSWIWTMFSMAFLTTVFASEKNYVALWHQSLFLRGLTGWIIFFCFTILFFLNKELIKTKASIKDDKQAEQLRKDAELFKLRQQLQPHFLFNSLNSINALIGREPQQARQMLQQLSDYLRNTIKKEDDNFISFDEEMNDLRLYLAIEQVRFGHRLKIEEQVEITNGNDIKVPPFLLQPLVENAIKYGLYGTIGTVTIFITVKNRNDELVFTITNPYDTDAVTTKGTGFGLESIKRRLYLLFARNDLLKIEQGVFPASSESAENTALQQFTATIIIPLNYYNK